MNDQELTRTEIANRGWNQNPPAWILALVAACDREGSQGKVARVLKIGPSTVSQAISNTYKASLSGVEERVRATYLVEAVNCPVLREIGSDDCLSWRDQASGPMPQQHLGSRLWKACQTCPLNPANTEAAA